MNLAINARDAMPKGGKLSIETRNDYALNPKSGDLGVEDPEPIVVLEVRDTGHGMDEDTIDRIFEPFFTTKEVGKGTGLGLSIVYGIVRQHGGHISAESEVGKGSVFKISLPSFKLRDQDTTLPPEADGEMILGGSEKILVVEDEESLRKLIQKILEGHGYKVSVAPGPQGVDEKVIDDVDLLLSDIVMPDGNGIDLFKRLRKIKPQLKVVLMSGYTDKPVISERKEVPFLQKPFSPRDLANTIRTVLDSKKKT
jgi:CheY-like chemotaxis protein